MSRARTSIERSRAMAKNACTAGEVRDIRTNVHETEASSAGHCSATNSTRRHPCCNCPFHSEFSKPHPNTGNKASFVHFPTFIPDEVGGFAVGTAPGDAYVRCELADNFVPQP